jgi:malonyl-CoA/methylmalonyl-CoA synthetase
MLLLILQPIFEEWKTRTGHDLLERYGMTEIGMALTNPLKGSRKPGFVGNPFPGVEVRIVDSSTAQVLVQGDDISISTRDKCGTDGDFSGDLQIRGNNVFKCYYERSEATAKEFTTDGWFKTGDTAQFIEGIHGHRPLGWDPPPQKKIRPPHPPPDLNLRTPGPPIFYLF